MRCSPIRELVQIVYEALARRWPKSRTRGRPGTPAEVVLRLLLLKHMRNWSYDVLEREVRANLVYRQFTRVGAQKVPDAKTLGKLAVALGPEVIEQLHRRVVAIACEKQIVRGRRLRVDTTVVETDIHYPTDSSLLGDGVRVLTRTMKRIAEARRPRGHASCAIAPARCAIEVMADRPREPQPCGAGPGADEDVLPQAPVPHGPGGRASQALRRGGRHGRQARQSGPEADPH